MGALDTGSRRETLYRYAIRATNAVVTVCEAARRELERSAALPAEKLVSIPNGIRVERFTPASAQARERLVIALRLPPQTRLIGTVGRLNWAKDHVGLIQAFAALRQRMPDCALVIVGDGERRAELAAFAGAEGLTDRVLLLGDRNDIADLLVGFDVFALSSLTEGYSIALLEACAAALPIVATDVGGNGEIVRDGVNGKLVPPADADALAEAMIALLDAPAAAQVLGAQGRAWVEAEGSLERMAERYEALYRGTPTRAGA
jgi:glycosyltransferase involved in cell wall biosynthesis